MHSIEASPLDEGDVEGLLDQAAAGDPFGIDEHDDFRISLAGAQEKTALLFHRDRWMKPHGTTPTTHILKLPLGLVANRRADLTTSVENEWLCLTILKAFGLSASETHVATFGKRRMLVVERFDRRWHPSGEWIVRLQQEDFCQVEGLPPHRKYEADGGPGVLDLARTLRLSADSHRDIETLSSPRRFFSGFLPRRTVTRRTSACVCCRPGDTISRRSTMSCRYGP